MGQIPAPCSETGLWGPGSFFTLCSPDLGRPSLLWSSLGSLVWSYTKSTSLVGALSSSGKLSKVAAVTLHSSWEC